MNKTRKKTGMRHYIRKAIACCMLITMLASMLQGFSVQPVKALELYESLFRYDGRRYIYEGEL